MNAEDWEIAHIGNLEHGEHRIEIVNEKTGQTAWGYVMVMED